LEFSFLLIQLSGVWEKQIPHPQKARDRDDNWGLWCGGKLRGERELGITVGAVVVQW